MLRLYKKWNYELGKFEPYYPPDDVELVTWTVDLNAKVNCAQCFKKVPYASCYKSEEIFDFDTDKGCSVCSNCYDNELIRRIRNGTGYKKSL